MRCLETLEREFHGWKKEFLIILNGEEPKSSELLRSQFKQNSEYSLFENKQRLPNGLARNVLIENAKGSYLFFIDDDAFLPIGYGESLKKILTLHPDIEIFGGPDQTPPHASLFQTQVGTALSHPLATGFTKSRHSLDHSLSGRSVSEKNLTLCNLWVKRTLFKKIPIRFHSSLRRNEENLLLGELVQLGTQMFYFSNLFLYHERKNSLWALGQQQYKSGLCRFQSAYLSHEMFHPFFTLPLFSLTLWLLSILISLNLFTALLLVYIASLCGPFFTSPRKGRLLLFLIFPMIHLSYAFGSFIGIFTGLALFFKPLEFLSRKRVRS